MFTVKTQNIINILILFYRIVIIIVIYVYWLTLIGFFFHDAHIHRCVYAVRNFMSSTLETNAQSFYSYGPRISKFLLFVIPCFLVIVSWFPVCVCLLLLFLFHCRNSVFSTFCGLSRFLGIGLPPL